MKQIRYALIYSDFFMLLCCADFGVEPPMFDLGIEAPPALVNETTPQKLIFAIQPMISPMGRASRSVSSVKPSCGSLPSAKPSCGLDEVSPADASRHLAQCIVLDIVHVTEQGIDPAGKVLYGQWITHPIKKRAVTTAPPCSPPWSSVQRYCLHPPDVLHDLVECCNELSERTVRWYVFVSVTVHGNFTCRFAFFLACHQYACSTFVCYYLTKKLYIRCVFFLFFMTVNGSYIPCLATWFLLAQKLLIHFSKLRRLIQTSLML